MSFFGMGPVEFLVIAGIAFIIFGPEKFAEVAGSVGKFVREFRAMSGGLTGEFQQALNEFQQVGGEIRQVTDEIQDTTRSMLQAGDPRTTLPRTIASPAATPSFIRESSTVGARPSKDNPLADFGSFAEAPPAPERLPAAAEPVETTSSEPAA